MSSVIAGMEPLRQAAREAIVTLRHEPIMAEDFVAQPNTPRVACLTGLRRSDLMVLILGERYGDEQPSGVSATEEEYREANGRIPVLSFVDEGSAPEPRQTDFVESVQKWSSGLFRSGFKGSVDLQRQITRALHDFELANAAGPLDWADLVRRAVAMVPAMQSNSGTPVLNLAVAGGPTRQILRPVELEDPALWDAMHQAAMFGEARIFDSSKGVEKGVEGSVLVLEQGRDGARVQLDEEGGLIIHTSVQQSRPEIGAGYGLPVILEEDVQAWISAALGYSAWTLEHIDPTQKLTHVAVAARITAGDYLTWRTQAEHSASSSSVPMNMNGREKPAVHVSMPRAALRLDRRRIVEDLLVPIRRHWRR